MDFSRLANKKSYSLRTLILAMTVVCLLLGAWSIFVNPFRQQANSLALVYRLKGDATVVPSSGPAWQGLLVETMLGDDTFVDVTVVDLSGRAVDDEALAGLRGLKSLTRLNLDRTFITDAGTEAIASFPRLLELSLRFNRLGDPTVQHLAHLNRLHTLYLTSTGVTDESIPHLAKLRGPVDLYIRWTQISAAGADRLRRLLPHDSNVFHDSRAAEVSAKVARN